jgi:seryl-tRNA synthetase
MIDFERGSKVTGSKFYFLTGDEALMEWNLINFMLAYHQRNGWNFVIPPYLINKNTGTQAGILPRFEGDYYQTQEGLMLIPTAETPLVGMHSDEIFKEEDLPIKYVAFSPCFRKEAGSYGAKDKGYKRVHQFHKIELFAITTPDQSGIMQERMVFEIGEMLTGMGVNWRSVELPPEERSPVSNKTIDLEVKVGDDWLEVSSISNTGDNQSKPAQIRYKPKNGGKNIKCHLLNGSGVALPRLMLALADRADVWANPFPPLKAFAKRPLTVANLAVALRCKPDDIIARLKHYCAHPDAKLWDAIITPSTVVDPEMARLLARENGYGLEIEDKERPTE